MEKQSVLWYTNVNYVYDKNRMEKFMNSGLKRAKVLIMILLIGIVAVGCRREDDTIPTLPPTKTPDEIPGAMLPDGGRWLMAEGSVVEDGNPFVDIDGNFIEEKVAGSFYVTDYKTWKSICANTRDKILKEQKDKYDEEFFKNNILICAIKTTSAGYQYEYEATMYIPENGKEVVVVNVSYSQETIRNTLANYYAFVGVEKGQIDEIDEIRLEAFLRSE